jgi:hypothetical protein
LGYSRLGWVTDNHPPIRCFKPIYRPSDDASILRICRQPRRVIIGPQIITHQSDHPTLSLADGMMCPSFGIADFREEVDRNLPIGPYHLIFCQYGDASVFWDRRLRWVTANDPLSNLATLSLSLSHDASRLRDRRLTGGVTDYCESWITVGQWEAPTLSVAHQMTRPLFGITVGQDCNLLGNAAA